MKQHLFSFFLFSPRKGDQLGGISLIMVYAARGFYKSPNTVLPFKDISLTDVESSTISALGLNQLQRTNHLSLI